jgi:hypothetical protein
MGCVIETKNMIIEHVEIPNDYFTEIVEDN